jgi:hypothetical protein
MNTIKLNFNEDCKCPHCNHVYTGEPVNEFALYWHGIGEQSKEIHECEDCNRFFSVEVTKAPDDLEDSQGDWEFTITTR